MKKSYTQPDFELVSIKLNADVLGASQEPATEDTVPVIISTEFFDDFD